MSRSLRDKIGICQWFHYEDFAAVDRAIELTRELGVRHLRTGISWADYFRPGGPAWCDWQMDRLRQSGLTVLLSVWHTPPSVAESPACNAPPRRLLDYADFIDRVINRYGDAFDAIELWNEPNNRFKWDFVLHDPQWRKFGDMVGRAAYWAKHLGKTTVLGGMIPIDHHWLGLMRDYGVLDVTDVVAIHGFPGMWFPDHPNWDWHTHFTGWHDRLAYIGGHAGKPIWVTETGLATWDYTTNAEGKFDLQADLLGDLADAPDGRYYIYSLIDLDPARDAIEGFHVDENEYHMGLVRHDGRRKPAFDRVRQMLSG